MDLEEKLKRFQNKETERIDFKTVLELSAYLDGWKEKLDAFKKCEICVQNKSLNLSFERKDKYLDNDITFFRLYFTIPFVMNYLTNNLDGVNFVTAHTISHYASINIHDVYTCLKELERQKLVEEKEISKFEEYKSIKEKKKRNKELLECLKNFEKNFEQLVNYLSDLSGEKQKAQKEFEQLDTTLKSGIELSLEEKELLSKSKPQYCYRLTDEGKTLLNNFKNNFNEVYGEAEKLLSEIKERSKQSLENLVWKPGKILKIFHIPEKEKEYFYELYKSLIESMVLKNAKHLFDIYHRNFGGIWLACIPEEIKEGEKPVAEIYARGSDICLKDGILPLKKIGFSDPDFLNEYFNLLEKDKSEKDKKKEYDLINKAIRNYKFCFANSKDEIPFCNELKICYDGRVVSFYTNGNVSTINLCDGRSINLNGFKGLVFLPNYFSSVKMEKNSVKNSVKVFEKK